ncbi:MAG TPA: AraC family transcriptional regulator [Polyangia bacterium]|nr:AraC family transcriptional regulator [Polyangia bacterium]
MTTAITMLPNIETGVACPVGEAVRGLITELARDEGQTALPFPGLAVCRYTTPTLYDKAATAGTTVGAVLQGAKQLRIGSRALTVPAGRMIVVTRPCAYASSIVEASRQRPYLSMSLSFPPERVARALITLAEAGGSPTHDATPAFLLDCDLGIATALERLLRLVADPVEAKLLGPLIVDEILLRLLRTDAAATLRASVGSPADAQRILQAMQYIRDNYAEKLRVDEVARRVAMSPSHFAHRFQAVARISPMRFLRQVRLDRARERLVSGARVSEVAMEVGFESPAHFTREFKRTFGFTPSMSRLAV